MTLLDETPVKVQGIATNLRTGVLYRNPNAHVKSVHAYFPSVVQLPSGKLLGLYTTGEAFEAVNLRCHLSESIDGGETWTPIAPPAPLPASR